MKQAPHILLLFLDGVGIGKKDPRTNPFFNARIPAFEGLCGGRIVHLRSRRRSGPMGRAVSLDATLGVEGLRQSGTGQTALLTGENAQRFIGKHFGPYPYSALRPLLAEKNIFSALGRLGKKSLYANAFPRQYFEYLEVKKRTTAITHAWLASGNSLNDYRSLEAGNSLSADMTNERWHAMGYPKMPFVTRHEAGRRLGHLTEKYDFVLYEYYHTDHAGHSQSMEEAVTVLERFDDLLCGILGALDPERSLLLLTSDHGNLEDLSTKSHTRNPVPLLAHGYQKGRSISRASKITDVAPLIVDLLK